MTTVSEQHDGRPTVMVMAMDLGRRYWRLAFTTGLGQRPRCRTVETEHWTEPV
jgi:hypothetical protein